MRKREYLVLLSGDLVVFILSLALTLTLRYFEPPSSDVFLQHLVPFSFLFAAWIAVFFIAGLYGKHTRLFRIRLLSAILVTQIINVISAALFFFFLPDFGIAPKTVLVLYLLVSSALIVLWRVVLYPRVRPLRTMRGVMIASGPDAEHLAREVEGDPRYPFTFAGIINTERVREHEVIQQACRVLEEDGISFLVVDLSDESVSAALPLFYDAAFTKNRFALLDVSELYEEVFDRVPLSFVHYQWVLGNLYAPAVYDAVKRFFDILCALVFGAVSLLVYPFVILAIKLDDGGPVFITQERVGRYQKPIRIVKFRSMSGNDSGEYGKSGKSALSVTRSGAWLRILRLDELPQLWNVLKGDLSIVGPRPELPALASHYSARIPFYNARYLIAPGLTGWAQIRHDRHPHHGADVAETKEKLSYDLFYLRHRSLVLDIYIIFQTIRIMLTARGS